MTKSKTHKKKGAAAIVTAVIVLAALSIFTACSNAVQMPDAGGGTGTSSEAPFVEGGVSFILSPDKLDITVKVTTSDGTSVTVEGCTVTTLTSDTETTLHAKDILVILKGKITELKCYSNQLTELNVQGLTALQKLDCDKNQLTALDVQGLTALQYLTCSDNQLTSLNVQGSTALQGLFCRNNQLIELNVQDLTALQYLRCADNQLTALNVQGLTALKGLSCYNNRLNADAFKKLFDDLPQRADSDGADCILYTEESGVTEGNHTDFTAPPELANAFNNAKTVKKWKMYKHVILSKKVEI
ncbi:leucine-rich repeat domain-containing protein [Treponema socranskii]|uniref:leucine-rich repeat domain-containing protein n=1 Tax=Treponema socranskii TaxID=53419 RepID=UPI0028EBB6EE|nr:leucine-rich repeat domain-containing protein [Treponema socranskii]